MPDVSLPTTAGFALGGWGKPSGKKHYNFVLEVWGRGGHVKSRVQGRARVHGTAGCSPQAPADRQSKEMVVLLSTPLQK